MSSTPRCPICGRQMEGAPAAWPQFPFCSPRCKLIDLGRWLGEEYGMPKESPDQDSYPEEPPEAR